MYLVKTPRLLKRLYPDLMWDTHDNSRSLYLTFDDGPIPIVTPFVLNILKEFNAKATFFCIGDNVRKHPDVFEQVKAAGHAIGNHTFNHLKGWKTDDEIYVDNFLQADKLLHTNLFRPPYGRIKRTQAKLLQQAKPDIKVIMWNILSADFDISLKPEKCLSNVLKNAGKGDIVLFHDSLKAFPRMEYALPKALEHWSKEGYEFKALNF
ncbi:peptidoglycan/xylan/chitin deacetylase (PgdA/CDA1 family) [Mucilaginibacter frigoritolerans]|jgi:peptidoglycan-N-acetylglucosamine deacetylase|uniref:Peptidoglycan/xylan/chitin deacetylase (PgdA/CDA1 family) n=1 Tax=Mucilaginibacter frigoritolerans TaxID=652788 RepID=A0A562U2J4_9SPHI|nr:polysaccharide deacetylase family protein [Mucilaginibacter frigoritolerans]TWJ00008.1 peptidoglycan/xylan/chitin deacetylase (PgdA/CDA1 family) [Mucilaginibacter frigoritolerans]